VRQVNFRLLEIPLNTSAYVDRALAFDSFPNVSPTTRDQRPNTRHRHMACQSICDHSQTCGPENSANSLM